MNFSSSKASIDVPDLDTSKHKKRPRRDKDATSPQPSRPGLPKSRLQASQQNEAPNKKGRSRAPNFHPQEEIDTMQTIDAADVGNASIDVAEVEDIRPGYYQKQDHKKMTAAKRIKDPHGRGFKKNQYYEESKESEHSDDSDIIVPGAKPKNSKPSQKKPNKSMHIETSQEHIRGMNQGKRGSRQYQSHQGRGFNSQQSSTKNQKQNAKNVNSEPEYAQNSSLNERAVKMVGTREYLEKVKQIKEGNIAIKSMEFIMDGIKIELPYNGGKVTQGYLKKEQNTSSLLLSKNWQMRYCILDLTKFVFRYAKAPTDKYTFIHLKDIVDIILERDPISKKEQKHQGRNTSFFSSGGQKAQNEGFNFVLRTSLRDYRLQANTKAEQISWARAFTILFELRARVSQNLKTTLDIDSHLGITGMNYQNFQKLQATLGEYDYDTINTENKKYLDNSFEKERRASIESQFEQNGDITSPKQSGSRNYQRELVQQQQRAQPKYQLNRNFTQHKTMQDSSSKNLDGLKSDTMNNLEQQLNENRRRAELLKKKQKATKANGQQETLAPMDEDQGSEIFGDFGKDNIEVDESINNLQNGLDSNTRESVFDTGMAQQSAFKNRSKSGNPQTQVLVSQAIAQKKAQLQKEMEANKKLLQATQKLKQFQRMAFSPVNKNQEQSTVQSFNQQMQNSVDRAIEQEEPSQTSDAKKDEPLLESISAKDPQKAEEEDEYYDEEYDAEEDSPQKIQTPQKKSPLKAAIVDQPPKPQIPIEMSIDKISPLINKKTPIKLENQKPKLEIKEPQEELSNIIADEIKPLPPKKAVQLKRRPETPEQQCIEKSVRLDTTLDEYEADGGDRNFKRTITRALKIDMSLMQITGKREGSVIIDFKIFQDELDMTLDDLENSLENVLQGDIGYPVLPFQEPKLIEPEEPKPLETPQKMESDEKTINYLNSLYQEKAEIDQKDQLKTVERIEEKSDDNEVEIIKPDDLERVTSIQKQQQQNCLVPDDDQESEVSAKQSQESVVQQFANPNPPEELKEEIQITQQEPSTPEQKNDRQEDIVQKFDIEEIPKNRQEDETQQFQEPEIIIDNQEDELQYFNEPEPFKDKQGDAYIVQQLEERELFKKQQGYEDIAEQFTEPQPNIDKQEDIVQQFEALEIPEYEDKVETFEQPQQFKDDHEDVVEAFSPPVEPLQPNPITKQQNEIQVIEDLEIEEFNDFTPIQNFQTSQIHNQTPDVEQFISLQSKQYDMKDLDDMVTIDDDKKDETEVQKIENQCLDIVKPVNKPPIKLKQTQVIKFVNKRKLIITKKNFESTGPLMNQSKINAAQISRFADQRLKLDSGRSSVDDKGKIIGACGKSLLRQFAKQKNLCDQSVLSGGSLRLSLNATGKTSVFRRTRPRAMNDSVVFSEAKDYQESGTIESKRRPVHADPLNITRIVGNRNSSILSNSSNISKNLRLSQQTKSILRQKLKQYQEKKATEQSQLLNISQDDMVQDISGINYEIAKEDEVIQLFNLNKSQQISVGNARNRFQTQTKQPTNELILEDFELDDDFTNVKSPGDSKVKLPKHQRDIFKEASQSYMSAVIPQKPKQTPKVPAKWNLNSKDIIDDNQAKKLERQNSRKRNIQHNNTQQVSSKRPPINLKMGEGLSVEEPRIPDQQSNPSSNTQSNNGSNPSVNNMGTGLAPLNPMQPHLGGPLNTNVTNNITNVYNITVVSDRNKNEDTAPSQIQKQIDHIDKASHDAQDQVQKFEWD